MYDELRNEGERTVGETIVHCTKDQLWRYVEALDYLKNNEKVLDIGCGCGYGTMILSHKCLVTGIDYSKKIIEFANRFYKRYNNDFLCTDIFNIDTVFHDKYFNTVVAFEFIEHAEDIKKLFDIFNKIAKEKIIISTPHISVPNNNKFHYRHFSEQIIYNLFNEINFKVIKMSIIRFGGGNAIYCVGERQ